MPENSIVGQLREERDASLARAIAAEQRVRVLDEAIARAERAGDERELVRLRGQRADAVGDAAGARDDHASLRDRAFSGLAESLSLSQEAIVEHVLRPALPIVLLPVRIETKFARTANGTELRVRLFPDDISISEPADAGDRRRDGLGRATGARAPTGGSAGGRRSSERL